MSVLNGSMKRTVVRAVVSGGLAAAVLVSPVIWSVNAGGEVEHSGAGPVVNAESGIDQLQWIYDIQPRVRVPQVDTSVHQSR